MYTITGGGSFTRTNIDQINANFNEVSSSGGSSNGTGLSLWVRPQYGSNSNPGTYERPLASMSGASQYLTPGMTVYVEGVLFEQYTTPIVNNVSIVGVSQIPRQATSGGAANGGGATWLAPSSVTTSAALIRVQGQGWTLANLYFNSAGITTNGCIEPHTVGDPPAEADGAHLLIYNCILTGAKYGIRCPTGTNYVRLVNSDIFGFSDSGDVAISATGGVGTLLDWRILGCRFYSNANGITAALNKGVISGCTIASGTTTITLTNGTAPNYVVENYFNIAADDFDPAGGVTGVTGDVWSNTLTNGIETGLPAN
jgi:hypothetical protein